MKILGMGVPELLIILVVILLIFGPKNLPKLGSALGNTVKNLRDGIGAGQKEVEEAADDDEVVEVVEEVVEELVEAPKAGRKLPDTLSVDEIDRLIGSIDPSTCKGLRDRAILEVLYSCGVRVRSCATSRSATSFSARDTYASSAMATSSGWYP